MATHTIDLLEHAIQVAKEQGVRVRTDWLDGSGGGFCRIGSQPWIFLDLSLSAVEQLTQVAGALRKIPINMSNLHPELARLLKNH